MCCLFFSTTDFFISFFLFKNRPGGFLFYKFSITDAAENFVLFQKIILTMKIIRQLRSLVTSNPLILKTISKKARVMNQVFIFTVTVSPSSRIPRAVALPSLSAYSCTVRSICSCLEWLGPNFPFSQGEKSAWIFRTMVRPFVMLSQAIFYFCFSQLFLISSSI